MAMFAPTKIKIDHLLAGSILDRLGYSLEDLSLKYGDVVIPSGDIHSQLWYDSIDNSCTIMGYVWIENDIYYASGNINYATPEQAALELLGEELVQITAAKIQTERQALPDYF
jgi:hypothetical protein